MPVQADQTDELVALVYGNDVVLRGGAPICSNAIRDQRFYFRLQFAKHRILLFDVSPSLERKQRFDGAGRARIKRRNFPVDSLLKKNASSIGIINPSH